MHSNAALRPPASTFNTPTPGVEPVDTWDVAVSGASPRSDYIVWLPSATPRGDRRRIHGQIVDELDAVFTTWSIRVIHHPEKIAAAIGDR